MIYTVTLENVIRGVEKAANGDFDGASDEATARKARKAYREFMSQRGCDTVSANILLQIILFGKMVY